jgi:hypothetical protein
MHLHAAPFGFSGHLTKTFAGCAPTILRLCWNTAFRAVQVRHDAAIFVY